MVDAVTLVHGRLGPWAFDALTRFDAGLTAAYGALARCERSLNSEHFAVDQHLLD